LKQPISGGHPASAADPATERLRAAYGLLMQNRLAEAEKACRAVLFTAPNNPLALDLMGLIMRVADNEAGAHAYFRRAVAADPKQPAARLHLASLLMAWLRFAEAEAEARQALKLQPRSVEGVCYLAICRLNLGHPAEAIRLFRSALAIAPDDSTGWR
jgi:predicted Zn-dependent protease